MAAHIMIDGIDGSGKGVATDAVRDFLVKQGKKLLDLRSYWKEHDGFPDISSYDAIIATEPTFTNIGYKIRFDMVQNKGKYTNKEIAIAYSDDRKELYEKVVVPAKQQGKTVVQERGVVASLVYQPLMSGLDLDFVMKLDGNAFCLKHLPDILIIAKVDPAVAIQRLAGRNHKQDKAIFEKLDFLKKLEKVYESAWLKDFMEKKGTKVFYIDTNPPRAVEDTKNDAIKIVKSAMPQS